MKIYPIDYVISYAREHSPYYKKLYSKTGGNISLENLPLVNQAEFWEAAEKGEVCTGEHTDGQIFKSGGTTGSPKHALYSAEEWRTMCESAGMYMPVSGLKRGDKIANLFYGGGLYASFLFCYNTFFYSPVDVIHYGLSGNMDISETAEIISKMKINAIAGLPSKIMNLLEYMADNKLPIHIDILYYAGETFYPDQRSRACAILDSDVEFRSVSYASNDAGFMAYFHKESCGFNEHRSSDLFCKLEIIDPDTGEVITEPNRPGQIYVTSLYKLFMPIIRYPAGDMGEWIETEGVSDRKFKLLGRSEEAARIAYIDLYPEDVVLILEKSSVVCEGFQMVITHENGLDKLTIRVAAKSEAENFIERLYTERPFLKEAVDKGDIHAPEIEYCKLADLEYNKRTGKLKRILDKRL
jgi:phenylacetate-CoA ligase